MKTNLLQATRMVAYLRNFQTLAQKQRDFSSKISPHGITATAITEETKTEAKTPEREIHLLGPKDLRAPLPGDVGIGQFYITQSVFKPATDIQKEYKNLYDHLERLMTEERQRTILEQFQAEDEIPIFQPNDSLELTAQTCPWLVKRDLSDLFPNRNLLLEDLTVITVCHKTKNNMNAWSPAGEVERDVLTEQFVSAAQEICNSLKEYGYWTDFIDPSSGRPYLGEYTNATFFETDERYRYFGLKIEDLGCCKVISHHIWGTNAFVGSIFTNAPLGSEQINTLLNSKKLEI